MSCSTLFAARLSRLSRSSPEGTRGRITDHQERGNPIMLQILSIFGLSIIVGVLLRHRHRFLTWCSRAADWAVCLMLFLLGLGLGASDRLVGNLATLGWLGLAFCLASVAGSLLLIWPVYVRWFRGRL